MGTIFAILLSATSLIADEQKPAKFSRGAVIHLDGVITTRLEHYLYRKLRQAQRAEADLLIIEIDSPGGEIEASVGLARHFRQLDWAHTVAYVPREALSGAAIAALGCDEIVMHPAAVLGDAGPIVMDFMEFGFRHAPEKIQTDLARKVRDLAAQGGRAPALAEAMVDKDLIVYHVRHRDTGEDSYMSDDELDADPDKDLWEKLNPVLESREDKFLEVNGERAVELGLADVVVQSDGELHKVFGLDQAPLLLKRQIVDVAVDWLNSPWITGLLFVVGLIALYIEFSAPGISIGGLVALLCFALFFWSRFLGGTAGWLEVTLFVAGVAFVLVEIFVIPGFGVAGVSGILLMFSSLVMAGQNFLVPESGADWATLATTLGVIFGSGVFVLVGAIALTWYFGEIPILSRLALRPPAAQDAAPENVPSLAASGQPISVTHEKKRRAGDIGIATSPLRPAGVARFGDDFEDVVSEGTFIEEGQRVKVVHLSGNRIVVREIEDIG